MKKQGALIYDPEVDRMDIRFGPLDFYGGLHCGDTLEVLIITNGSHQNRNGFILEIWWE